MSITVSIASNQTTINNVDYQHMLCLLKNSMFHPMEEVELETIRKIANEKTGDCVETVSFQLGLHLTQCSKKTMENDNSSNLISHTLPQNWFGEIRKNSTF